MNLTHEGNAAPNTRFIPKTFSFLEPTLVKLKNSEGIIRDVRYGIGDKIEVLVPEMTFCIFPDIKKKTIKLTNGSEILEWPDDMKMSTDSTDGWVTNGR